MPQPRNTPTPPAAQPSEDLAAKLKAAEDERDAALADLEAATAPGTSDTGEPPETASYVVVGAGACYLVGGDPAHSALALRGNVIDLVEAEARRLLMQGAVRAATKEDAARDQAAMAVKALEDAAALAGPVENPYGGQTVAGKTLEQHADEQIALAKKASKS